MGMELGENDRLDGCGGDKNDNEGHEGTVYDRLDRLGMAGPASHRGQSTGLEVRARQSS